MDYTSIVSIGLPGLMIAWGDTIIVLVLGVGIMTHLFNFDVKDSIVVAGKLNFEEFFPLVVHLFRF
jgi:hypothetical protein